MTINSRASRLLASILVLAALGPAAAADTPARPPAAHKKTPTAKELEAARAHFRDAEAAKARGDYQTAAVEYLAAYELFEEPEFFFDTAEVYRLGGDDKSALTYYEKYLELDPTGRGAATARTAADTLRRSIAAAEDAARRTAEDAARKKADAQKEADAARLAAARAHPPDTRPDTPDTQDTQPDGDEATASSSGRGLRVAAIASGGAGVLAIGVGVAFGVRARGISTETATWTAFDAQRYQQGKAAQRDMYIFTGVGAAALIAGGVLYYLGHRADESAEPAPSLTFAPAIGPSQIAFTAAGSF